MVKDKKNIPEGIWILSIFSFIVVFIALGMVRISLMLIDNLSSVNLNLASQGFPPMTLWSSVLIFIFMSAVVVLGFSIGRGLLKSQDWTRIAMGVLATLGFILSLFGFKDGQIAGSLFGILVNGVIAWYLLIKDSTKKYFK